MTIQDLELLKTPEHRSKPSQCIHFGSYLQSYPTYAVFAVKMGALPESLLGSKEQAESGSSSVAKLLD